MPTFLNQSFKKMLPAYKYFFLDMMGFSKKSLPFLISGLYFV